MAPLVLTVVSTKDVESSAPMADETAGRAAWLAAVADPSIRVARLVRTSGPHALRWRCEWTAKGTFHDATDAHYDAIRALLAELNATTGATSTSVATPGVCSAIILDGGIRFCGPTGTHLLGDVACNTEERVRAHWAGYTGAAS